MKIQNLFERDIHRPINGVVKADQLDAFSVWQELDEFVVTRELTRHINDLVAVSPTSSRCSPICLRTASTFTMGSVDEQSTLDLVEVIGYNIDWRLNYESMLYTLAPSFNIPCMSAVLWGLMVWPLFVFEMAYQMNW